MCDLSASDRVKRTLDGLRHDGLDPFAHERVWRVDEERLAAIFLGGRFEAQLGVACHWCVHERYCVVQFTVVQRLQNKFPMRF